MLWGSEWSICVTQSYTTLAFKGRSLSISSCSSTRRTYQLTPSKLVMDTNEHYRHIPTDADMYRQMPTYTDTYRERQEGDKGGRERDRVGGRQGHDKGGDKPQIQKAGENIATPSAVKKVLQRYLVTRHRGTVRLAV